VKGPASGPGPSRHRDDYSRLDARQRTLARQAESRTLLPDDAFRGRAVLFINDINVSGAQQQCMRQYFDGVGAAEVHWLYILDVAPSIGHSQPMLENVINSASHASFEGFAALLRREEVDYTGKCLARLFSCSIKQLEGLLPALGGGRIQRLLDLTLREGAVTAEDFDGYSAGALWQDTKIAFKKPGSWEKIAMVSDEEWLRRAIRFMSWLVPGEVNVYSLKDRDRARDWVAN